MIKEGGKRIMLFLSTAQKLKSAGLVWEPKEGDWYSLIVCGTEEIKGPNLVNTIPFGTFCNVVVVWLPSLSQLLAEIEARGYRCDLFCCSGVKVVEVYKGIPIDGVYDEFEVCEANTAEEAAGQAVLWILEQEGKHEI